MQPGLGVRCKPLSGMALVDFGVSFFLTFPLFNPCLLPCRTR